MVSNIDNLLLPHFYYDGACTNNLLPLDHTLYPKIMQSLPVKREEGLDTSAGNEERWCGAALDFWHAQAEAKPTCSLGQSDVFVVPFSVDGLSHWLAATFWQDFLFAHARPGTLPALLSPFWVGPPYHRPRHRQRDSSQDKEGAASLKFREEFRNLPAFAYAELPVQEWVCCCARGPVAGGRLFPSISTPRAVGLLKVPATLRVAFFR